MAKPKQANYSRTTLATLTSLAQARGLPTHGTKIELISRLVQQDHAIALDNKRTEAEVRAAATGASHTSNTNTDNEKSAAAPGTRAKRRRKRPNKKAARGDKGNENGNAGIGGTVETDFGPITVEGTTVVPGKKTLWLGKVTTDSDVEMEMEMEPELLEHVVDAVVSVVALLLSVGAVVCGLLVLVAVVHLMGVWVGGL